jgi:hypothetical protein
MIWLVIAVVLVLLMKESMEIYDGYGRKLDYSMWDLICVPYSFTPTKFPLRSTMLSSDSTIEGRKPGTESTLEAVHSSDLSSDHVNNHALDRPSMPGRSMDRSDTIASYEGNYIRTCITMPSNFGIRSWRWYEAIVESLAVGLYLYATFILTSTVFLFADKAIIYATVMTVCLSATRVLTALF